MGVHMLKFNSVMIFLGTMIFVPALYAGTSDTLKPMSKDQTTKVFSDKTIKTISAATIDNTVIADSFMGYVSKDGKLTGKFAQKPNGQPEDDTGTWKVDDHGRFCFKWEHWDKGQERCVTMYELSNSYLVVNDKKGFESLILKKDISNGNQLSNMKP